MDLSDISSALRYAILFNDMLLIVRHFDAEDVCDIHPNIAKGQYSDPHDLYQEIVTILTEIGRSHDLLDMMPFIDDYIETYFNI